MKKIKKLTAVIMTIVMLLTVMPLAGIDFTKASALEASGQLTDTISYTFDEATGTLTISGTGAMPDYDCVKSPFYDASIKNVIIEDGVTSIGKLAFIDCKSLTSGTIPDSVTSIDKHAFYGCNSLTDIYYGGTEKEWNAITIGSSNDYLLNANIHFIYGGYLEHTIEDGKAAITGIISDSAPTKVVIPSEIDGCPVTKIYGREFCNVI